MGVGAKHEPPLDGLRGIACLAVVAYHVGVPGFTGGGLGVDVFFVLSGYLITRLLAAELSSTGAISFGRFWMRRARRLVPALALVLAAYVALAPIAYAPAYAAHRLRDALIAGLYLMDYAAAMGLRSKLSHTWSLAVEAQFYALWPLVLPLLLRAPRRAAVALLGLAWLAITVLRAHAMHSPLDWDAVYNPFHYRVTGLLVGSALALWPVRAAWAGAAGVLMLAVAITMLPEGRGRDAFVWGIPMAELASALIIVGVQTESRLARVLGSRPLVAAGLISYGLYLWHAPLAWLPWGDTPWWIKGPAVLVAAGSLATISYVTVEAWARGPSRRLPSPRDAYGTL